MVIPHLLKIVGPHIGLWLDCLYKHKEKNIFNAAHKVMTARVSMDSLQTENVEVIPWPAFSPDPRPIEHMWNQMGRRMARRVPMPQTRIQLIQALREEWHRIPQDRIRRLVCNMRQMCLTCANANGGHTRYLLSHDGLW